jgi:hypothetical protein
MYHRSPPRTRPPHLVIPAVLFLVVLLAAYVAAEPSVCKQIRTNPDHWVGLKIDALVRSARETYEDDDDDAYSRVLEDINRDLRKCKLRDDRSFTDKYRRFLDFVQITSLDLDADHELGFSVSDKQYFEETKQFVEIPEFLLNTDFLNAVSSFETLDRAKTYLRELNLTRDATDQLVFFSYRSRHLGTPDNVKSFQRLLIVVPGNSARGLPDKWVQFGIPDPKKPRRVRNISVVAAAPGPPGSYYPYFKDFYRTYKRDGSITITGRWELGEGDDNCVQCHKSGVLPIFPVAGTVALAEQQALLTVNERFRSYGSPRFGNYLDTSKLGPGLSSASAADRRQRFGESFENTAAGRAMICSSCHNPERLGSFSWPMDSTILSSFVEGGQMPYGGQLQDKDRRELYTKLVEEYFATDPRRPGILKSWLLGHSENPTPMTTHLSEQFMP